MTSAAIEIPPSNQILPGSHHLSHVTWPKPFSTLSVDAGKVAVDWVSSFNNLIKKTDYDVSGLFLKESHWRDLLCLTWDFHNLQGPEKIISLVKNHAKQWRINSLNIDTSSEVKKPAIAPVNAKGDLKGVQSFLTIDTDVGRGRGLVRLLPDPQDEGKWKAFTLFTTLQELKGHEESINHRRPTGVEHGSQPDRKNWKERRAAEVEFEGGLEPTVLIIGIVLTELQLTRAKDKKVRAREV